ncbi:UNVERIFIED_CONTAM: hypothetical protein GTU68_046823 [Idotea baltica]|nr:hypothetical protein [Idotea baltica]
MLPGEGLASDNLSNIIHDLVLLHSLGVRLVLVYGARPQITNQINQKQIKAKFHNNLRITDSLSLQCVIGAIGQLRTMLEAKFSKDVANSPMQGARLRVMGGNFIIAKPIGVVEGIDYQYTGQVRRVDSSGINQLLDENTFVMLPSLGYSSTGEVFNLSCDEIATQVAIDLQADKLLLFGIHNGLLHDNNKALKELSCDQVSQYLKDINNKEQQDLLVSAERACREGVLRSHIISYAEDGALLKELFTRAGTGTLVSQEQFETMREASIDDVAGLIELIAPLEQQGVLVRRSREILEHEIERFSVIEREGLIIACAALYPLEGTSSAELACLAVHPEYRNACHGDELLLRIESRAKVLGLKTLFVLTTKAAHWFQERGFVSSHVSQLPASRASLYNFQRNSKVFKKQFN